MNMTRKVKREAMKEDNPFKDGRKGFEALLSRFDVSDFFD